MKTEKVKYSNNVFTKHGGIVPFASEDEQGELSTVRFEDGDAVAKVSVRSDMPFQIGKFLIAKCGVMVTVPCQLNEEDVENAYQFASKFCEAKLAERTQQYKKWLESQSIDWEKIEKGVS